LRSRPSRSGPPGSVAKAPGSPSRRPTRTTLPLSGIVLAPARRRIPRLVQHRPLPPKHVSLTGLRSSSPSRPAPDAGKA
jgi:hypothetical protein